MIKEARIILDKNRDLAKDDRKIYNELLSEKLAVAVLETEREYNEIKGGRIRTFDI